MARNKFDIDEVLERDAEFRFTHLNRLGKYMKPYKPLFFKSLALVLISSGLRLLVPLFLKTVLDESIPNKDIPQLLIISLVCLGIFIIDYPSVKYRLYALSRAGQGMICDLRLDLFRHLQALPNTYYDSRPHGKILVRVVNYINSISDLFSNGVINLINDLFSFFMILIMMFFVNVRLTLVCLGGLPLLALLVNFIRVRVRRSMRSYNTRPQT